MRDYLLFRLYGPLAAWGDIAVGEVRPSFAHPSKSAIIGLLAAALGIRRDEVDRQRSLVEGYLFAIRIDALGRPLRDYHTIQMPSSKPGITHHTRRSELASDNLNTIVSSRDYRCDAVYTVAIEVRKSAVYTARQLADALTKPVFTLYLGRKSCPLAMPVQPKVVAAGSLKQALESGPIANGELTGIVDHSNALLYWEEGLEAGFAHEQIIIRRDESLSRMRWQFGERREQYCSVKKEDKTCSSV